jgi:hypothetical protein
LKTDKVSDLAKTFIEALKWMESLTGKPIQGRLRETEKIAFEIGVAHEKGLIDEEITAPLHEKYTLVAPDVRWIIDIYNYLKDGPLAPSFAKRMRRLPLTVD